MFDKSEMHPPRIGSRIARKLRVLRYLRGWERTMSLLIGNNASGSFVVSNRGIWFAGDLSSFIDRQMYVRGECEGALIKEFLSFLPLERRRVILDVGANVGTHSLVFARYFDDVYAFEPNPKIVRNLEKNISLNGFQNIHVYRHGLADVQEEATFFLTEKNNFGLGTCSDREQYDVPLIPTGKVSLRIGDQSLREAAVGRVDAIKIDVQGYEAKVIRGLRQTLKQYRPFIWFEVGSDTIHELGERKKLEDLIPFKMSLYQFVSKRNSLLNGVKLHHTTCKHLETGNYLIAPKEE